MVMNKAVLSVCFALLLGVSGCSRQQSDWEKTRAANTTDSYEQFIKKYPSGEFTAQAQARVKELYEENDWQKARDADTQEAYQAFLKQYPEGKWTEEARIRVENFTLAQAPSNATPPGTASTGEASGGAPPAAVPAPPPKTAAPARSAAPATTAPATTAPATTAAPAAVSSNAAGSYGIQLGAFKSGGGAANRRWAHLDKAYPKLLTGLSPTVAPKKGASGTLYRLQVVGLTEKHARSICKFLKAKSQACVLIRPDHHH
jgi:cell division protein FtsN